MKYRPEIDGLRALAVVPVILYHAGFPGFSGGFLGVDIFFVISGYLIGGIIYSELLSGSFSILRFYERRARRILPALFAVTLASTVAAWLWLSPEALSDYGKSLVAVTAFASNIHFWREAGYFATDAGLNPLLHTWSLAVEEQFYIFFPLLMAAMMLFARGAVVPVLLGLTGVSLGLAEWTSRDHADAAFYLIHTRAWELFAGAILAICGGELAQRGSVVREALAGLGLALCLISFAVFDTSFRHPSLYTLAPVLGAVLLIGAATSETLAGKLLSQRLLVGIGLISYSLYLVHQPVFAFMRIAEARDIEPVEFIVPILACFALAFVLWKFVEQPFRDRSVVSTAWLTRAALAAFVVPLAIGMLAWKLEGFSGRISPEVNEILTLMQNGQQERAKSIHAGRCRFNKEMGNLEAFFKGWDCLPKGDGPAILVYGDSHSADKAWALQSAGVDVANLGAHGCPPNPGPADKICSGLMTFARGLAKSGKIQGLVIAHRWSRKDVSESNVRAFETFWSQSGVPVLLFTPMPEFTSIKEKIVKIGHAGSQLDAIGYDANFLAFTVPPIRAMAGRAGFSVIDTKEVFCAPAVKKCSAFADGKPLVVDYGHLSNSGALAMGRRIVASQVWQDWVAGLKRQ